MGDLPPASDFGASGIEGVTEQPFGEALSQRYLTYALSTIMSRSLPDVRDGLKPVHRRLLWAMRLLKLDPSSSYKKCARVVGDVMGKYHPHGDQAIYDALVRLAQDFSVRYPLIDGQGNFGNVDGDNAAAMRYTEARLTAVAALMMEGLDEECVPFRATYDGEEEEPIVFPGGFPNLLANGAAGIAVGMATSVPPHNVAELADGLILLVDRPDVGLDELLALIPGPDFPTGGVLIEPAAAIREAYATGRGSFRLRARWQVEDQGRGTWVIVITQVPYQVQKSRLIEQIAQLINDKKLPILEDVRDESSEDIRLVIEPKSRNVDPDMLMESLFRMTDLDIRFPLNLNVLDRNRAPRVMGLKDALAAYLDHQLEMLLARTRFRIGKIDDRLELLAGYIIAYLNLDEVIRIIREEDEPKPVLMERFTLTDRQAEAILNMRLRSLRKLEEMELRREDKALKDERKGLKALQSDPAMQRERLKTDLARLKTLFGSETALGRRRTSLADAPLVDVPPPEALIEREPLTVICSAKGWIRAMKGHAPLADEQKFKEGDGPAFAFHAQTTDKLLIVAANGKFFTIGADKLPGGRGFGEPLRLMVDLDGDVPIIDIIVYRAEAQLLLASSDGRGFVVGAEACLASTRSGKQIMTPRAGESLRCVRIVAGDTVAVIGENRKLLLFPLAEMPEMTRGQGVLLQKYKDGGMADVVTLTLAEGLSWPMAGGTGRMRSEKDMTPWLGVRAQSGRLPPMGFPKSSRFGG